jgi:hypothetical protein
MVEAALPAEAPGEPPKQIHARVDCGALQTTRHALRQLVDLGRAESAGPRFFRTYWRRRNAA